MPGLTQGITCHCPKAPSTASVVIAPKASHDIAPRYYLPYCMNVSHVAPRHHMPLQQQMQLPQARHQVSLPQEVHVIAPRYYMSLPQGPSHNMPQGPNHNMRLPGDISCNCPMAIKAISKTLGTTCHCPRA